MTFTILTDSDIKNIFSKLSNAGLLALTSSLERALIDYSVQDGKSYQPHRGVVKRPDGQVSLFMPATTEELNGVKIVGVRPSEAVAAASSTGKPQAALKSVLTLCDRYGEAIGVLNAAEITAFRTSLGSMLLYRFRKVTDNIVVFGAGKQALWHIRLAILLRGQDIKTITVVNRSKPRTVALLDELKTDPDFPIPSHITLTSFDNESNDEAAFESLVASADAIFCTTPSTQPLFPATFLASPEALKKTRYIAAIGSYRLDMQEIDPELLKMVINSSIATPVPHYQGGVVTVDSAIGCLDEAGELVKAGVSTDKMLEAGQILQTKKSSPSDELDKWLESGFVIYKSVGIGVMDLAIGEELLRLAKDMGVGVHLPSF